MSKSTIAKIKFYEVINWIFSHEKIPEHFLAQKSQLNSLVPYITEQFWMIPKATKYLNDHTNDLFNIPDPIEHLKLLKKIVIFQKITKNQFWSYIPERKRDIIKEIEERDNLGENDARAKERLMKIKSINASSYFKVAPTKKNIDVNNSDIKESVSVALAAHKSKEEKERFTKILNSDKYIRELTQDVIDELELVLFDVSLLKKTNRVLFTFIDYQNYKRYYTTPFSAKIYISKKDGVINNNYIESLNGQDFEQYLINEINQFTRLKYGLNNSYKRILNVY
jgi:hypothetical protein